jgi:hypothetical protein
VSEIKYCLEGGLVWSSLVSDIIHTRLTGQRSVECLVSVSLVTDFYFIAPSCQSKFMSAPIRSNIVRSFEPRTEFRAIELRVINVTQLFASKCFIFMACLFLMIIRKRLS